METLKQIFVNVITLLIIFALGYMVYHFFFREDIKAKIEYWEDEAFKTDTIKVVNNFDPNILPDYKNYVPPQIVVEYPKTTSDNITLVMDDSLISIIDSLQGKITQVHQEFLKQFPEDAKLIQGVFDTDTIRLTLFNIDGVVRNYTYPVNYSRFKYQYKNGSFKANPKDSRTKGWFKGDFSHGFYVNVGYDLIQTAPLGGLEYNLSLGRLKLDAETYLTINRSPEFFMKGTIGVKVK